MYKATGDKAYLYKFILQSLCMMENRHDLNASAINNDPRWSFDPQMYQDGYIIAAFSRFIYFVKLEEPSLFNEPVHQFDELNPANYAANTCNCNNFGRTVFNQIVDRELKEGIYNIPFSSNNLPSGFYQCILTIDNQTQLTNKIVKQ